MNAYAAQLQDMTRTDLYNLAKDANLPGRSKMTKDQLLEALIAAQAEVLAAQAPEVEEYYTEDETPASDHNPRTEGQVAAVDLPALSLLPILMDTKPQRIYTTPAPRKYRDVTFERTEPGHALAEMYTNESGITRSTRAVKNGKVWELVDHRNGVLIVVKARTFNKLAKRWAKKVGVWADDIQVISAI